MSAKQQQRSEETRKKVIAAAGKLFAGKGYDAVTMREIAKESGCSHTTIYIYFKDKEALLTELSMPPLQDLLLRFEALLATDRPAEDRLKAISLAFISFCLANRNTYPLFFATKAGRVDDEAPDMKLNKLRNRLFGKLTEAVQACLGLESGDPLLLTNSRIYFFTLNGIVATYKESEESGDQLMARLEPTFRQSFDVLIAGFESVRFQS